MYFLGILVKHFQYKNFTSLKLIYTIRVIVVKHTVHSSFNNKFMTASRLRKSLTRVYMGAMRTLSANLVIVSLDENVIVYEKQFQKPMSRICHFLLSTIELVLK